jgi:plastocyanin
MRRIHLVVIGVVVAAVFAASATSVTMPRLSGTVGPGATISLKQGAKKVATLKAGRYSFVISDKATTHNFHLTGPGVNKATSVGKTGNQTWVLTLKKGTYRFVCDPHASFMKGSFRVT